MKYIMFEVRLNNLVQRVPVIFPNSIVHKDMSDAVAGVLRLHWPAAQVEAVGAGSIVVEVYTVLGQSKTMGLKSSRGDAITINTIDHTGGYDE